MYLVNKYKPRFFHSIWKRETVWVFVYINDSLHDIKRSNPKAGYIDIIRYAPSLADDTNHR